MGKKRSWFGFLKRFFICKAESKDEKVTKKRRWCFGIIKMNHHYHALKTPEKKAKDHEQDHKHHTMALATAMTAAADAAVAAANAAAVLARLVRSSEDFKTRTRTTAAIKIQAVYRAHLARKALLGLRGVVKLQAIIRGQIVRRKISKNMLQSEQLHQIWVPRFNQIFKFYKEKQDLSNPSPRKDSRTEQILEHSSVITSHNQFDHQETSISLNHQLCRMKKLRLRHKLHHTKDHNSLSIQPRMLYKTRRNYQLSVDPSDDTSLPNSPVYPAYMATTESFMAKSRSLSTPRQRVSILDGSSLGMPMLGSSSSFKGSVKDDLYSQWYRSVI